MMKQRSTFPFLALARKRGISYADVMSYAHACDMTTSGMRDGHWGNQSDCLSAIDAEAIIDALADEELRRTRA